MVYLAEHQWLKMGKHVRNAGLAVLAIIGLILLTSQRGRRGEFSPYTLEYRVQSERTIYATGVPFYRSSYEYIDPPVIDMLINEGFVTPQTSHANRWKLVFHWNDAWIDGDTPLCYMFLRDEEEIIDWSRTNRECAQLYWSEVFRLLRLRDPRAHNVAYDLIMSRPWWRITDVEAMQKEIDLIKENQAKDNETLASSL